MDQADVLTLKYAYGMAAVSTGIHKVIGGNVPCLLNFLHTCLLYSECSKIQTKKFYHGLIPPNDANRIENSEDPDQTCSL